MKVYKLKNVLPLVILLFTCLFLDAQNQELDDRNGFKEIKLGSHYDMFKGIYQIGSKDPKTIAGLWSTSDPDLGYLFDEKIDVFELEFDKQSKDLQKFRVNIVIKKPYTDPEVFRRFKSICDKLISVLGKPDRDMKDEMGFIWKGNKVLMGFLMHPEQMKFNDEGKTVGLTTLTLMFASIEGLKEKTSKGF